MPEEGKALVPENKKPTTRELKFLLWSMKNDLEVVTKKESKPLELTIRVVEASKNPLGNAEGSINAESLRSSGYKSPSTTISYVLVVLIIFAVAGVFLYQFLGSPKVELEPEATPKTPIVATSTKPKTTATTTKKQITQLPTSTPNTLPIATKTVTIVVPLATSTPKTPTTSIPIIVATSTPIKTIPTSTTVIATTTITTKPTTTTTIIVNPPATTTTTTTTPTPTSTSTNATTTTEFKYALSIIPSDEVNVAPISMINEVWTYLSTEVFESTSSTPPLTRVVFNFDDDSLAREPLFDELVGGAGFSMPRSVFDRLDSKLYNLYLFKQTERLGITKAHDMRMILIAKIIQLDGFSELVSNWEQFMLSDLAPRLFLKIPLGTSTINYFKDSEYAKKEPTMVFRYMNFPTPDLSLDYIIDKKRNLFIITTSRESAYAVIDKLLTVNN